MDLQTIFGDLPIAKFIDDHLYRTPFALAGSVASLCDRGSWDALAAALASNAEVLVVQEGKQHPDKAPRTADAARDLCSQGFTLCIRHAERHVDQLADLAAQFAATFRGPVDIQFFATPAGQPGFSWHYDAEDVFIVQTAGEKEYWLRKNTVNPWPVVETIPADMRYEREVMPMMRVLLRAGDLLYIPCGWWHRTQTPAGSEAALSLAIGVMSPTGIDLYDFMRPKMMESLLWRQRLSPGLDLQQWNHVAEQLVSDLRLQLMNPRVSAEFLSTAARAPAGDGRHSHGN